YRQAADHDGAISVELGALDRARHFGGALLHGPGHPGQPAGRRRLRRVSAARYRRHRGCLSPQSPHRAQAHRALTKTKPRSISAAAASGVSDVAAATLDGWSVAAGIDRAYFFLAFFRRAFFFFGAFFAAPFEAAALARLRLAFICSNPLCRRNVFDFMKVATESRMELQLSRVELRIFVTERGEIVTRSSENRVESGARAMFAVHFAANRARRGAHGGLFARRGASEWCRMMRIADVEMRPA